MKFTRNAIITALIPPAHRCLIEECEYASDMLSYYDYGEQFIHPLTDDGGR